MILELVYFLWPFEVNIPSRMLGSMNGFVS